MAKSLEELQNAAFKQLWKRMGGHMRRPNGGRRHRGRGAKVVGKKPGDLPGVIEGEQPPDDPPGVIEGEPPPDDDEPSSGDRDSSASGSASKGWYNV